MMSMGMKIAVGAAGLAVLATVALGIRRAVKDRRIARIVHVLRAETTKDVFNEALVDNLPVPAQRYFRHAIQPGTQLARSVQLQISGRMRPQEGAHPVDLAAQETLAPPRGFVWTAQLWMGLVPIRVQDHYARGDGAVSIHALSVVPLGNDAGPDVTRSSQGRLAGESVWLPSALLPGLGASWEAVDDTHARVTLTIDGEAIPLTLQIERDRAAP